ncbi:MAG: DNA polymerase III subunit delta', partial [Planctomycetota bacterium]
MWLGIYGHDEVVEQFRRILASNRLATTYLFIGPDGVGKRTFALRLAQSLLCTARHPAELDPCGQCTSCRLLAAGNHPDLDVIGLRPEKQRLLISQFIGEDQTRNRAGLCHNIALRPMLGSRRVAIIDDADWFSLEAANCLLKTLEEPPPGAVLILVGTSRSRQLPTILSRAQIVRFRPLETDVLRDLILQEGQAADLAAATELARLAGGSLSRARDLADPALWEAHGRFVQGWTIGALDAPRLARDLDEFIAAAGKEAEARRQRFRQLLGLVAATLRHELRAAAAGSGSPSTDSLLAALDRTLQAEEELRRNANLAT